MSPDDWQSIIDDSRGDDARHATLTYDGVVIDDVGVHPSGESSRLPGNQKQSIRVKFDDFGHGKFGGLKEINIKGEYDDHSMLRERLAYFVFRKMLPTPQAAHVRLVVNGQVRGLYTIREVWDADSVGAHFSQPLGPLYRVRGIAGTDPYADLGTATSSYVPLPWEPHIGKPARGDDVVPTFLGVINSNPAMLDSVADVDDLLDYLAAFALVMCTDGYVGDHGVSDHFQYFDPQSGKFFILPWDPDNTFSSQDEKPDRSIFKSFSSNALARLVRDTSDLHARYIAKLNSAMSTVPAAAVQAEADAIYQQIQQAAYEDPFKAFTNADFDWSESAIKDFIAKRYASVQEQAASN
jgi:spore coat protein CotH